MSLRGEELYRLLPAIYRLRDEEQGGPLRALLEVIGEQAEILEENLAQLYDDQFIETCADWVVPYIGDLVGARGLYDLPGSTNRGRAQVANTIAYRRRKGTAAVVEELARDATGWPARVVEFFGMLAATQHANHPRPQALQSPDLRTWEPLELLETPFDILAHTADVRRITGGRGKHNIPNVGIFLWRLGAYPLTRSDAFRVDGRRYKFSPLGNDAPLYARPASEDEISLLAGPGNVPAPLGRRMLHAYLEDHYGSGMSLLLRVDGQDILPDGPDQKLSDLIRVANLGDDGAGWAHMPEEVIYIDPELGRIAFPEAQPEAAEVLVTYHYGFGANLGGGEYDRAETFDVASGPVETSAAELETALGGIDGGGAVEIIDNGRYEGALQIDAGPDGRVELRSADGRRPTVALSGDLAILGGQEAEVTLNGLLVAGGTIQVGGDLGILRLRHCTLVPGLNLDEGGGPEHPGEPSLVVEAGTDTLVEIDHCILGGIRATGGRVRISDSIVDAAGGPAYATSGASTQAGAPLSTESVTVIGEIVTTMVESASNSIFLEKIEAERVQEGSVRFSYVAPGSITPRRYRCQPGDTTSGDDAEVRPSFTSLRYGDAGYGQIVAGCSSGIREGADDGSEMGAFHSLYAARRETNLRVRLDEYVRFGLEVGIFHAS